MQHPDKTLANIRMKHLKTLETYACNMHVYATSRSILATSRQNTCNIYLKQMKHLEHNLKHTCIAITTCATSQSTFATSIYNSCNISQKHLKHLKYTIATCAFSLASACCLDEWRLVDAELDTATEFEAAEWHEGHRCRAHRRHRPQQGQADGARPRWEARVRERANERLVRRACRALRKLAVGARVRAARARMGSVPRAEQADDVGECGVYPYGQTTGLVWISFGS
jgi:hypothetical protein